MKVKEGERVFETMKRILDMAGKYRRYITNPAREAADCN